MAVTGWRRTLPDEVTNEEPFADSPVRRAGRLAIGRTCRLFIGGRFQTSESGRYYAVTASNGTRLATAAQASRKDVRDAVSAARGAVRPWSALAGCRRGQLLYQVAELLDARRGQLIEEAATVGASEPSFDPETAVDEALDLWLWYVGWADKLGQVLGGVNPVDGPYANWSAPEPTGVVGIVAPRSGDLLGLVSVLAPAIVSGNTAVVLTADRQPLPATTLGEIFAVSSLPAGVVNLLCGSVAELAPWLAGHRDVDALDLSGVADPALATSLAVESIENLKRVIPPAAFPEEPSVERCEMSGLHRIAAFCELKTIWNSSSA